MPRVTVCRCLILSLILLALAACSDATPLTLPDRASLETLGAQCATVYAGQVDAWASREPERLRQIYTDDIVHFDGDPAYEGIDEVIGMAEMMFRVLPDWQMAPGETYISADKCAGAWRNWGLFGFTEDQPGVEYDVLETRSDKIAFWRLFYDPAFYTAWGDPDYIDRELLTRYVDAWTEGGIDGIQALYARDAVLTDTLLGVTADGRREIVAYAQAFYALSPDAAWTLVHPFAEGEADFPYEDDYPYPAHGGVFAVEVRSRDSAPCTLQAMVVLTPNGAGQIAEQETFWAADTLAACNWVE
jgi:ketosteroid isomerase-like protein